MQGRHQSACSRHSAERGALRTADGGGAVSSHGVRRTVVANTTPACKINQHACTDRSIISCIHVINTLVLCVLGLLKVKLCKIFPNIYKNINIYNIKSRIIITCNFILDAFGIIWMLPFF
jgi:hypothetical protein